MELSDEDQKLLGRLIAKKLSELDDPRSMTESDKHEIAAEFIKSRKSDNKKKDEDSGASALSSCAKKIHTANVAILYKLIDKIEKNQVKDDVKLADSLQNEMPDCEKWNFSLGDRVVIDIPRQRFKYMQSQTLGWKKRLENVVGQYGFITDVQSQYDCKVQVYFPDILTSTLVYPGCLTKTREEFHAVESRWKVGQLVKTRKNKALVAKFQKRLPDLPEKHIGKTGRAIALTSAGIFVTFNEKSSYAINPALLQKVEDSSLMQSKSEVTGHPKKFKVGDKVRVSRNLRKLIENQKGFGGWNWKMSSLAGKLVTIGQIKKDGSLILGTKHNRPWRFNYESVYTEADSATEIVEDLQFMPGDIVRLRLTGNIKMEMLSAKVLESCMEFLKLPAVVEGIDDDFDVVVRFNNGKKQVLKPTMIKKVSKSEERLFETLQAKKASLQAGDTVKLALGPRRYVEDIITKIKPEWSTIEAMTQEAELLGYLDEYHAIIRYESGRKLRINCKYLAPAGRFDDRPTSKLSFDSLRTIVQCVQSSVAAAKFESSCLDDKNNVDIFSVTSGTRPTVCLRIDDTMVQPNKVIEYLKRLTEWSVTEETENECSVKIPDDAEFDLVLICDIVEEDCKKVSDIMDLDKDEEKSEPRVTIRESEGNGEVKADPIPEPASNPQVPQTPQSSGQQPLPSYSQPYSNNSGPIPCLFHNGTVYFPMNNNAFSMPPTEQRREQRSSTYNITNIHGNVDSLNHSNNN